MKGLIFRGNQHSLNLEEVAKPKPVKDQFLIRLKYAALNHRDIWIYKEQATPAISTGVILGSDGAGIIEDAGPDARLEWVGAEVIINPSLDWGDNPVVSGNSFKILGYPDHGTFAQYIAVSKKNVFERPENLNLQEAVAMPLSGLTAYRALFTKARLRAKEKILITGIGGGTALWALQFAVAYQARVYVTSGSDEKIQKAKSLGAIEGFNYRVEDWAEKAQKVAGGFDIIIDTAGGPDFQKLLNLAMPGGRIVNFGRTAGNIGELVTRTLFSKQLSILGTTMGTRDEFLSMIDFVESRNIKPTIDLIYPLTAYADAFNRMETGNQFGKIILTIS